MWGAFRHLLLPVSVLMADSATGRSGITCAAIEHLTITPPSGQTCQQYLGQYISNFGGYITNPGAVDSCQFCPYRTTDAFLQSNSNIFYSHHWRNFCIMWIYVGFNVRRLLNSSSASSLAYTLGQILAVFAMTYIFRIRGPANLFSRKRSSEYEQQNPSRMTVMYVLLFIVLQCGYMPDHLTTDTSLPIFFSGALPVGGAQGTSRHGLS
jgi:ATP-binding cassette subfamily G (WHITE) protein 2 (SNQ2)